MIRQIDIRGLGAAGTHVDYSALVPRASFDVAAVMEQVRQMCAAVREHGHAELLRQAALYDGVEIERVRVPTQEIQSAFDALDPALRVSLEESVSRLRRTCEAERPHDTVTEVSPGGTVTQRNVPVDRVGLYVPAATAPLCSSVLMNVVPAQVAGVSSLALASPAQREHGGLPHPLILAACALLGVDEVYAAGGAGAVAMFAYGYQHDDGGCAPVDLVTGPANIFGVAAKRLLRGIVGIDSEAGPTEIAILADDNADPTYLAADLVAQAEHDPNASCLLVSPSEGLLDAVDVELDKAVAATRHRERVETALAGQSAYVLVDDLEQGLGVVDEWAAEHLEVVTRDARSWADRVTNAGAVFVGPFSPVSLGDYLAGSNHVLPTAGTARHTGGLSVQSFLRSVHVVEYDRDALAAVAHHVDALGGAEDLAAHVDAVRARIPR